MWFHNLSNGMDQDSLNKWKEEFQNERQEQYIKVRQLQKETQKRRKAMDLKRKLDAAKEEKRRQEALAERKAQHVEATMRFQKGIKNFKVSKEKISLEDALKSLNKRTTSADERYTSQNSSMTSNLTEPYNFYNNNNNNRQKTNNFSIRSNLRRSSSFNDVNVLISNLNKNNEELSRNNNSKVINNYKIAETNEAKSTIYDDKSQQHNNNNEIKFFSNEMKNYNVISKPIDDTYKTIKSDISNINPTFKSNSYLNSPGNTFKVILEENQKTIQNFNKEALNDFKNIVMNEVKSNEDTRQTSATQQNFATNNTIYNNNIDYGKYTFQNFKSPQNNYKPELNSTVDETVAIDKAIINEDISSISSDNISDTEDSLEVDSLKEKPVVKARIKSAVVTKKEKSSEIDNGIFYTNTVTNTNQNSNLNTNANNEIKFLNNDFKNSFNNQVSNIKNHFITKTLTNEFFSNNLLLNKKTYFAPQFNNENGNGNGNGNGNNHNNDYSNNLTKEASTLSERVTYKTSSTSKLSEPQIKSILKRSTSDNNLHLIGQNGASVHFGIKAEKIEVKDSIEIANSRMKPSVKELNSSTKKKSVRFAQHDSSSNEQENEKPEVQQDEQEDSDDNFKPSRGSYANKKPAVKPRTNSNAKKPPTATTSILHTTTNEIPHAIQPKNTTTDGKPPLPIPPSLLSDNSYQTINQKRKEFLDKFKNKNYSEFLTSPKSANETKPKTNTNEHDTENARHQQQHLQQHHHQPTSITFHLNDQTDSNNNNTHKVQSNNNHTTEYTNSHLLDRATLDQKNAKKNENTINTFNNKYGFTESQPPINKHLLPRFNYTTAQTTAQFHQDEFLIDQNSQTIDSNNLSFKKVPQKTIMKAITNTASVVEIQQLPPNNQPVIRRPYSANTPLTNENISLISQAINQNNAINQQPQVPRINTKLMTFNVNNAQTSPQRILSADSGNQHFRYRKYMNSPMIQLKIQYPANPSSDNFRYMHSTINNDENATLSMDEFLRAEQMCNNTKLTESKVISFLEHMNNKPTPSNKGGTLTLSMEEQNVKNSIQKLNDKLNILNRKTQTGLKSKTFHKV